jgi:uracil-DNA glycosylase
VSRAALPAPIPRVRSLAELRRAEAGCTRCELHEAATQTVHGEGRDGAWLMLVGEQPGDREDEVGRPFVGPSGRLLERALADVGVDRDETYLTNAVRHFRWESRGARRIHKTPGTEHVRACLPWLMAELELVQPRVVVCLGAVAGRALLGPAFRVTRSRGRLIDAPIAASVVATVHPSAVLRDRQRQAAYLGFVDDLQVAASARP